MTEKAAPNLEPADRTFDLRLLAIVAGVLSAILMLIVIVAAVRGGGTQALDEEILSALRRPDDPHQLRGPAWLGGVARDITSLGSTVVLVLVVAAVFLYLLVVARTRLALLVLAAGLGAHQLSHSLKYAFGRARPDIVPHLDHVTSASFPSGHALGSAAVFLTLAALLARIQTRRRAKIYVLSIGIAATALVGLSRVLLGVHYPSDVVAGWLIGALWALACDAVVAILQRRGAVSG